MPFCTTSKLINQCELANNWFKKTFSQLFCIHFMIHLVLWANINLLFVALHFAYQIMKLVANYRITNTNYPISHPSVSKFIEESVESNISQYGKISLTLSPFFRWYTYLHINFSCLHLICLFMYFGLFPNVSMPITYKCYEKQNTNFYTWVKTKVSLALWSFLNGLQETIYRSILNVKERRIICCYTNI
jgi:hypothetical protein